jgi:4-hydroxybenzoate polyprenyltransferase
MLNLFSGVFFVSFVLFVSFVVDPLMTKPTRSPDPPLAVAHSPLTTHHSPLVRVRYVLEAVRIQESLFALPFAYMGMLLAAGGLPPLRPILWVTLAMIGARNAGMAFNRVLDREMDALNPRTADRHLPRGLLQPWELTALGCVGLALFFLAAWQLNPLALALSPVAALFVVGYSLAKRYTWLTHLMLGVTLSIAPVGGWVGVTGSLSAVAALLALIVATFAGGFDIFNTCPDVEFDRAHGVHSLPARFGLPAAFRTARLLHVGTSLSLLALGLWLRLAWPFYVGWVIASALLVYEHLALSPDDLSRLRSVFLKVNAMISLTIFGSTLLAVLMGR